MWSWLQKKLQLRPGEGYVTLLMFFYIFSVLAFYYILKPLRSGLFLKSFPASHLPYAYFLTAFLAGMLATLIFKLSRRASIISLLTGSNIAVIITLFCFHWAMGREFSYLPYFYFVYVQIVSALSITQFWLLAGLVYDNRQSKRIYPLLGAGAISGATLGSLIPGFLSAYVSTQSMLLICIGICLLLIILSHAAWGFRRPDTEQSSLRLRVGDSQERVSALFRLVFGSRHILLITSLVFLTLIGSQIADWQVHAAAQTAYQDLSGQLQEIAINALFGRLYFVINFLGIVLQLTITGLVVRHLGVSASILFLPVGLFLTSLGVLAAPILWATVLCMGSNSVFRHSINRTGLEVLYLPLSSEIRKKIKVFVDVFVDRFGRAVGGLIILAITNYFFPRDLRAAALVILLIAGLCIFICIQLRKSYVEIFREKLSHGEVDLSESERYVTDPRLIDLLVRALDSAQERQVLYSLRLLQAVRGYDFARQLLPLLKHELSSVREEALHTLPALEQDYTEDAVALMADPSENVRLAAIDYYCRYDSEKGTERIEILLNDPDVNIRISAAKWASDAPDNIYRPKSDTIQSLLALSRSAGSEARVAAAGLASRLSATESVPLLRKLLGDEDSRVVGAAALAIGSSGHKELVPDLVHMLPQTNTRATARQALVRFGPGICRTLAGVLTDEQRELSLRREIPWILGQLGTPHSFEILMANLNAKDLQLKYQVLKALNRMNDQNPALLRPSKAVADRIYKETKIYCHMLALSQSIGRGSETEKSLLRKALSERLDQYMEIIFRLLGLQYFQRDIYSAYTALKGSHTDRRTSAVEFLDNILHRDLKSVVLPLLEESSPDRLIEHVNRIYGIRTVSPKEALRLILNQQDTWLKACALYEVGRLGISDLADECQGLMSEREPLIREMSEWAMKRCA